MCSLPQGPLASEGNSSSPTESRDEDEVIRRRPLKRGSPPARSGPPRKKNPARKLSEWKRCYLSKSFVAFTQRQPCAACGSTEGSDCAHTEGGGMSRKGGWETLCPLCRRCHTKQHQSGWMAIAMTEEGRRRAAANLRLAWADHQAGGGEE